MVLPLVLALLVGPPRMGVGDFQRFDLAPGPDGTRVELAVVRAELLVILVDSFEADVRVRVEDAEGRTLAEDDDSGVETNARLAWTPTAAGTWRVVVLTRSDMPCEGWIRVLRGRPDLDPPDPSLAARAYWDRALDASNWKKDRPRVEVAIGRLLELTGASSREKLTEVLEKRNSTVRRVLELQSRAVQADRKGERAAARGLVAEAAGILEEFDPSATEAAGEVLRRDLAALSYDLYDPALGAPMARAVLAHRERVHGPDHPYLQEARMNTAVFESLLDRGAQAQATLETVQSALARVVPDDHLSLQAARIDVVHSRSSQGDFEGARELCARTATILESLPDTEDPRLWHLRGVIADHLRRTRELSRARVLQERVLAHARANIAENPDAARTASIDLASVLSDLGDLAGALDILRDTVAEMEQACPDTHPLLILGRTRLGTGLQATGDRRGSRALFEAVLEASEASLPEDSQDLQDARENLATAMLLAGDAPGAVEMLRHVVSTYLASRPASPALLDARVNLAVALERSGEYPAARDLLVQVVVGREKSLREDDLLLANARGALASVLMKMGDLAAAAPLFEKARAATRKSLPWDHPKNSQSAAYLAHCLAALGEKPRLREVLQDLARCASERLAATSAMSPREATEAADSMASHLSLLLSFAPMAEEIGESPFLAETIFELLETRRAIAARDDPPDWMTADDTRIAGLREQVSAARARIAELAASSESRTAGADEASRLAAAVRERDRAELALRSTLAAAGCAMIPVRAAALEARLAPGAVAVGFHRYMRVLPGREAIAQGTSVDSLLALVVAPGTDLRRIELGPIDAVVAAIEEWRSALGSPVDGRGRSPGAARDATDPRPAGERLRRLLIDPIRDTARGARELVVCLDDVLHLVPLDALPDGAEPGAVVGDRLRIRTETSFRERIAPMARRAGAGLLAIGDVDYAAEGRASARVESVAPLLLRGGAGGGALAPLPGTAREIEALDALYFRAFDARPSLLRGATATKATLVEKAPGARFIHLATHGYFTPETVVPPVRSQPGEWQRSGLGRAVADLSPMVLCGLALAGADRGPDSLGRVPGILTAEELAGMDLSRCELAVLSACETNVGIARAGLGIQSLQAALHAAGARTAITSLWRVDDARTKELMEDFYTRVWIGKEPKSTALWNAKKSLRAKGAPARDWAGWVLTGDPD